MTDAEKMREAAAQWCADEADRCEDAAKWGGHRKYVQDCKAAAFALRNAWSNIRALPLPEPTEALVTAERALWVPAIESYFDATAVMDVEKHVERLRAKGRDSGDV